MTCKIIVSNLDNNTVWDKSFNFVNDEYRAVKNNLISKNTVSFFPAALITVRTNNFENFCKDFFFPTVVNHAIKIQSVVHKIFAVLLALTLDIITFPIRLITIIPRVISNARQEEVSLRKYLVGQGVDPQLLASDRVFVRLEEKVVNTNPTSRWTHLDGTQHQHSALSTQFSQQYVNFIELPEYEGFDENSSGII